MSTHNVPMPDLRIVPTTHVLAHEDHDVQRSTPLIERMRHEAVMINPPLVAPLDDARFVVLDGANRAFAFSQLGIPHILVQVAPYDSGLVELATWHHVVCGWSADAFIADIAQLPELLMSDMHDRMHTPLASIHTRAGRTLHLHLPGETLAGRNHTLNRLVRVYQAQASLQRTTIDDPEAVWHLHPTGQALILYRPYQPHEIVQSAALGMPLPPGVSRHVVHGRAIRVNYAMDRLRDETVSLEQKNADLLAWMREKLAQRQVRYYAESTYQFDE
jgi:hypothetical protein